MMEPKRLLEAEAILAVFSIELADEFQKGGSRWSREIMEAHVCDREAILRVREMLMNRVAKGMEEA